MSAAPPQAKPLPTWLKWAGSLALGLHFLAIGMLALASPSGPWPTPFGSSMALAPSFAGSINDRLLPVYLSPLRMTHNYHFITNRLEVPEVSFEVRLKDKKGKLIRTMKFPSDEDNSFVAFRQRLLAQQLADDEPVTTPRGEVIPAPGKKMETISFWAPVTGQKALELRTVPLHLAAEQVGNRPVYRPRDWSTMLARSYMRYLCRQEGAASAELIRHSRDPIFPGMMFVDELPPGTFEELLCNFGEHRER